MNDRPIETALQPEWLELTSTCRPHGRCLLLTREGVAVIGEFDGDFDGYVAFFALPRVPAGLKERLREIRCGEAVDVKPVRTIEGEAHDTRG